jgi:D-3-phosphoglycerate dehydrogenase
MQKHEKPAAVIADYDYGDVTIEQDIIEGAGFELIAAQCKTEDDIIKVASNAQALLTQYAPVGAKAISSLKHCQVIARYGTGVDIVDVDAATQQGILVTNVPGDWCENEVADHAMAMLLTMARKMRIYDRATRLGIWQWRSGQPIHRLRGRTLGLFAPEALIQALAMRGKGFGLRIIAHDPSKAPSGITMRGVTSVSFDELLEQTDYLIIQPPLSETTRHLIGEAELQRMKPGAFLLSTAHGPIVDEDALYHALKEGRIAGAALDELVEETGQRQEWEVKHPLFSLDNVLITPHVASYSEEALHKVREFAAQEVVRVLSGKNPLSPVNADQIAHAHPLPSA